MGFTGHLHDRLFFPKSSRFLFFAPKRVASFATYYLPASFAD